MESVAGSTTDEPTELRDKSLAQAVTVGEAELAMMASRGTPSKRLEPLTLFHLRDALMVSYC